MGVFKVVKLVDPLNIVNIPGGFTPRGAYNAGTNYGVGDSVSYNGSSYVMFVDAAAGTIPTNTTYWQLVAGGSVPGGAVDSVNGQTGTVVLTQDDVGDGTTNKVFTAAEKTNLAAQSGTNTGDQDLSGLVPNTRTVNTKALSSNIVLNQDDIGDGTTYKQYSSTEKTKLSGIATAATANDTDANLKNRANHTGTQLASTISDFATAADARVAAAVGSTVQAYDADLATIAGLTATTDNFLVATSSAWASRTPTQARTQMGLGSIATQAASSVTITGGSITGITDLVVADGGTGVSTLTGIVKGNGTSAFSAAVAGTDYVAPTTISTNGKGFVNHGSVGSTARPSGFASIEWFGTATPANAVSGDTWIDTN